MDPEFPPVSLDTLRLAGTFSPGDPPDGYLAAEAKWKASWRKDADELEKKGELDQAERLRARVRYWEARAKLYTEERLEAERPARIERMLKRLELAEAGKESPKDGGGITVGHASSRKLAEIHGVDPEALRGRLTRWRHNNAKGWMEVEESERGPNDPQFLYQADAVQSVIAALKGRAKTSGQRPAKK